MARGNINDAKCVLAVGATAGIGRALALAIHDLPSTPTIIVSGRRKERLDELCQKSERIKAATVDLTTGRDALKKYVDDIVSTYPELDTVILSSGVQQLFNFKRPEEVDLDTFELELTTNYTSVVTLIRFFLPHFLERSKQGLPSFIIPITSQFAILPGPHVPGYCATKAALHSLSLSLNHQLENTKVQIMEILPPLTESELHDQQGTTPHLSKSWMPLDEFTKEAMEGLTHGDLFIAIGLAKDQLNKWEMGKVEAVAQAPPTPN